MGGTNKSSHFHIILKISILAFMYMLSKRENYDRTSQRLGQVLSVKSEEKMCAKSPPPALKQNPLSLQLCTENIVSSVPVPCFRSCGHFRRICRGAAMMARNVRMQSVLYRCDNRDPPLQLILAPEEVTSNSFSLYKTSIKEFVDVSN